MIIFIILAVAFIAVTLIYFYIDRRRVKNMTKVKLIEKCKKLIDEGRADKVENTLMHHPLLLLQHFNELQTTLSDYARTVEECSGDK